MVRGKFQVIEVAQVNWSKTARKVRLQAVYDQTTEENRRFAQATPSGSIEMTIDNPPAAEALELGQDVLRGLQPGRLMTNSLWRPRCAVSVGEGTVCPQGATPAASRRGRAISGPPIHSKRGTASVPKEETWTTC